MKDNEIIASIREARHAFAAKHGHDLEKMAKAVSEMVDRTRFHVVSAAGLRTA